jgi:hypothetical protein
MPKFKKIIGGTKEDVYKKFSWLKDAKFENAIVDITKDYFIWEDGIWKGGIWKWGTWKWGTWKDGTWEGGTWEGGTWEGGTWKWGVWKGGIWEGGTWEKGIWEDGIWEGGTWRGGKMWDNLAQKHVEVKKWDGRKFVAKYKNF